MKKLSLFIISFIISLSCVSQKEFEGKIVYLQSTPGLKEVDTVTAWLSNGRIKISITITPESEYNFVSPQPLEFIYFNDSAIILDFNRKKAYILNNVEELQMLQPKTISRIPLNSSKKILGFECIGYLDSSELKSSLPPLSAIPGDTIVERCEVWLSSIHHFNKPSFTNTNELFNIVVNNKISLARNILDEKGNMELSIEAISIKEEEVPDSIFSIPTNYQIIRSKGKSSIKVTVQDVKLEKIEDSHQSKPIPTPPPPKVIKKKKKQ